MLVMLTLHPDAVPVPTVIVPAELPIVGHHAALPAGAGLMQLVLVVYLTESAKYASSAVTMFRRSDFIEAMYAFSFVLANFGIAMAARMPMITTTISSSMSVKPLRFILDYPPVGERWAQEQDSGEPSGFPRSKVTLAGVGYRLRRSNSRGWRIESPCVH